MAERRKNKKKKEADVKIDDKPSKEEYAIAKYLKQSLPEKKTTLLGHKVEYFIGSKAVDCLAESQWAKENKKGELNFSNRDIAVDFMARLLEHKFFHRAKKIVVQRDPKKKKKETEDTEKKKETEDTEKKKKETEDSEKKKKEAEDSEKKIKEGEDGAQDSGKEKESKKSEKKSKSDSAEKTDEKDKETKKESGEVVEKKKEKKKIKLDMHLEQIFIDSNEPYVWIYDPIPLRTWITGTLMVIAAVLLCLFPLWPQTIRHYIYYLSVAAAFFLVFIIGLAVLRLVVFVLVWLVTFGKHHLWLLPNLTEDVGFFESFWPLYKYEYKGNKSKDKDSKDSDSKDTKRHKDKEKKKDPAEPEKPKEESKPESQGEVQEVDQDKNPDQSQSESDQDKSEDEIHKTDNGFEFLEAEEASESPVEEEDRKTK